MDRINVVVMEVIASVVDNMGFRSIVSSLSRSDLPPWFKRRISARAAAKLACSGPCRL